MKEDAGKPLVERSKEGLGVRPNFDIHPDENGMVQPGNEGMSVAPSIHELRPHLVPLRLEHIYPDAQARNSTGLKIWRMGTGAFVTSMVTAELVLVLDPKNVNHGVVAPVSKVSFEIYELNLASTRELWEVDESGE